VGSPDATASAAVLFGAGGIAYGPAATDGGTTVAGAGEIGACVLGGPGAAMRGGTTGVGDGSLATGDGTTLADGNTGVGLSGRAAAGSTGSAIGFTGDCNCSTGVSWSP